MIYFVRHGSTEWNENKNSNGEKDPRCQGHVDLPLNEKGISQAKETALTIQNIKFDRVLCSPLLRARQTCEYIYHGDKPVEIDNRLIERDFGEFEGKTRKEFDFYGFWNRNSKQKYIKAESLSAVEKRIFNLIAELKKKPNDNILIVAHGGIGCVFVSYFKGTPKDDNYLTFELPHGKPIVLDFNEIKK